MSAGFTLGPWRVVNTGENVFQIKADAVNVGERADERTREYYKSIASVVQRDAHPQHDGGLSFKTCEANAKLIASAPDLLAERDQLKAANAELAKAIEAFVAYDDISTSSLNLIGDYDAAITKCRAALTKHQGATA